MNLAVLKNNKEELKRLLQETRNIFDSGQKITETDFLRLDRGLALLEEINNVDLEIEYWLLYARVARTLVEVAEFAKAVFALENLVTEDLKNEQVFNYHYFAAIYYLEFSDTSLALDHVLVAQKIAVFLKKPELEFKALTIIAVVFSKQSNPKTSLKITQEALAIAKKPDEYFIAFINLAESYRQLNKLEKCGNCLLRASHVLDNVDDYYLNRFSIMKIEKQGWLNLDLGNFDTAKKDFQHAISSAQKTAIPHDGYFSAMEGLGAVYFALEKYEDGIYLYKTVLALETASDDVQMRAFQGLAKTYKAMGDYKTAYESLEKANDLEKKIRDEKSESKLKAWEAKYNFNIERRDKEIAQKKQEILRLKTVELQKNIKQGQMEMLERLALAAEIRDDETSAHTKRVGRISAQICRILGLDGDFAKRLGFAAEFHDIGKIGIPDSILLKPGSLTQEEFDTIKRHTTIGAEILANSEVAIMQLSETIAISHHERWDGSGYPNGLQADNIPLAGRIVAVADAFDAMTSDRPYRKALDIEIVKEELMRGAGGQFDAVIAAAFLDWIEDNGVEEFDNIPIYEDSIAFALGDDDNDYLNTLYHSPLHEKLATVEEKILVLV